MEQLFFLIQILTLNIVQYFYYIKEIHLVYHKPYSVIVVDDYRFF